MAALGFVLAIAGAGLRGEDSGASYFLWVGILLIVSGLLFYSGKKLGLYAYGLLLAVIWIWTLKIANGDPGVLISRLGLLTLIGFYVFSYRVRSRLY